MYAASAQAYHRPTRESASGVHGDDVWILDRSAGIAKYSTGGVFSGEYNDAVASGLFGLLPAVSVDASGDVYVADNGGALGYGWRVSKFDASGNYMYIHFGDSVTNPLLGIAAIAVGPNGDVYVAEGDRIARYHPATSAHASYSLAGTPWSLPTLQNQSAIAVAPDGSVFVADTSAPAHVVKLDSSGHILTSWTGGGGSLFSEPLGIAIAPNGHVIVCDREGQNVWNFHLQDIGPLTYASANVTVKKGKTAKLKYEVKDDVSNSCTVWIKIYKGGALKKTISLGRVSQGAWHTKSWKCTLKKGTYTWRVYANDGTGHKQRNIAKRTFKVK